METNRKLIAMLCVALLWLPGCGAPSEDERGNRKEFELLLTAITLKSGAELQKDAARIERRHTQGKLSDSRFRELTRIINKATTGDWEGAEKAAYTFREANPFFK